MLPEMPPEMREAQALGITLLRRRGGGWPTRRGAVRRLGRQAGAAVQPHGRPAVAGGRAAADPAASACAPHVRLALQHRSGPRLSLPVLVLHHHQRAGPQEPIPLAGRSGADHPRERRSGHQALLHHRRQLRAQPPLGTAVRPDDRAARGRVEHRLHHPGGHAVPPHTELHREGRPRRRAAGVHRPGEHQPGEPAGRQEAAEPHHRISRDAAGVARGRCHHLCRLHHRLSRRHQGIDPARCRDHQARTAARHPGILLPHAAAGFGGPQGAVAAGRLDGSGPEQVRPQPSRDAPSAHVGRRSGRRRIAPRG